MPTYFIRMESRMHVVCLGFGVRNPTGDPGQPKPNPCCLAAAAAKHRQVNYQIGEQARAGVHPRSDEMQPAIPCFNLPAPKPTRSEETALNCPGVKLLRGC